MITVIIDQYNLVTPEQGELVLSEIKDYVPGYDRILASVESGEDISLYIQNKNIEVWINRMAARYPQGIFTFEAMTARKFLEQKWKLKIPDYVTNEDILESKLLDLDIAPTPGSSFENIVLEEFYGPVFTSPILPSARICEILRAFDETRWEKNASRTLTYRIYQNRLDRWRKKAKEREIVSLVDMIEEDISKIEIALMKYSVLRSYPKIGKKLLGKLFTVFQVLKPNLHDLELDEEKISNTINQITYHLNAIPDPNTPDEAYSYISRLSGLLMLEFNTVERILKKNPELLSLKVIGMLTATFNPISNKIQRRLAKLKDHLKPPTPDKPEPLWTVEEMMSWATKSYLPFFRWADRNGFLDDELANKADIFSQWLFENWEELRGQGKNIVFKILPDHFEVFNDPTTINLVIVIDNFGWNYSPMLERLFLSINYALTDKTPYLAMIPTITTISKKCLLDGSPSYTDIDEERYTAIVEKGWVPYFDGPKFHYLPNLEKLSNISEVKHQTYVVNYLPIDKMFHQAQKDIGLPHEEQIEHLLKWIVDTVDEFINRNNLRDSLRIHIVSDHGSTRIPDSLSNGLDYAYFRDDDFEKITPRLVAVKAERFANLPQNLQQDCFFLEKGIFGNTENYLAARRANRFTKTDGEHYTHGSLAPEEVIVPYLSFSKITKEIEPLDIQLLKTTYRYRLELIEIEIANPNDYPVENVLIKILNSNVESAPYHLDWLDSKNKFTFSVEGRFRKTHNSDDAAHLNLSISLDCHGKGQEEYLAKLSITMKSMFEMKDDTIFDELD